MFDLGQIWTLESALLLLLVNFAVGWSNFSDTCMFLIAFAKV